MPRSLLNRFFFIRIIVLGLVLSSFTGSLFAADVPAGTKPNVVLFLIDDLGWRDLACYGSTFYETPHIDGLARQGMKFTNAYAACAVCSPTRASVLTGQYPARLHLTDFLSGRPPQNAKLQIPNWQPYLSPHTPTIASRLKEFGYATALVGKWHLGGSSEFGAPTEAEESRPEKFGFDLNFAGSHYGQPPDYFFPYERPGPAGTTYRFPNVTGGREGEYLTDRVTDEAEKFMETNKDRPFFLYVPHFAVHTSIGNRLQAKPELVAKYQAKVDPQSPQRNPIYAAMIESLDQSVGRLLRKLDDLQIADRTLVVFTSDNGGYHQMTSQSPLRGAKSEPYEGGVRVPLVVRWPKVVAPGTVCDVPVTSADLYPTVLAAVGSTPTPSHVVDGVDLTPLLSQQGKLPREAIYWHYPHYNNLTTPHGSVRQGDLKLIEFFEDGRLELYNLRDDLGETRNLVATEPDLAKALHGRLAQWRHDVGAQMPTPKK